MQLTINDLLEIKSAVVSRYDSTKPIGERLSTTRVALFKFHGGTCLSLSEDELEELYLVATKAIKGLQP